MIKGQMDFDLSPIQLDDMRAYLHATGWRQSDYANPRLLVYTYPDPHGERPFVVTLPGNQEFLDYYSRLDDTLTRLAAVEHVDYVDILRKIQAFRRDVISARLMLDGKAYPSMDHAAHFIQGMRDLITSAAWMEERGNHKLFRGRPPAQVSAQAKQFQLAHTFQGSFGFTIESALGNFNQPLVVVDEAHRSTVAPLQRRVLVRIIRGLRSTERAVQKNDSREISGHYEQGFNANLCKAACIMLEEMNEKEIRYDVHWSIDLQAPEDLVHTEQIILQRNALHLLEEAEKYLRNSVDVQEGSRKLIGLVTHLMYNKRKDNTVRSIVLEDEILGPVTIFLDAKDYDRAGKAHFDNLRIAISGYLVFQGKAQKKFLHNAHELMVL